MKKHQKDNIEIIENISTADDDIFDGIEGLPESGIEYHIYRQTPDNKEAYLTTVISPYSVADIKKNFGGGNYIIYVKDAGKILHRRKIIISGEIKNNQVETFQDNLSFINNIIELVNKINDNKRNNFDILTDSLSSISNAVGTLTTTVLTIMTENIKIMNEMKNERANNSILDVINTGIQEIGNIASQYFEMKKDKKISDNNKMNILQFNLIYLLTQGQQKNDVDYQFYFEYIKKLYPNFLSIIKNVDKNTLINELKKYGLKIINNDWIDNFYNYMIDKIK